MSTAPRMDKSHQKTVSSDILDRRPPSNIEAEYGVLGSMLLKPDVCDDVIMILRADDFYDDINRKLYEHMIALHDSGRKIDLMLLVDQLNKSGDFEVMGGSGYLAKIGEAVPNAAHAEYYARIIRDKATYRALIDAGTDILRDAYDETGESKEMLAAAEQKVFAILDRRGSSTVTPLRDALHDAMDRIDARLRGEHTEGGVSTGFVDFDELTGGLHNNELVILAARPSMGKTAFAMNIAENVTVKYKVPTLFVSLEMSAIELTDRLLCSVAKVNGHRLRNGTITPEEQARLVDNANLLSEAPLFIDDSPARTVTEIAAAARRIMRREERLGLVVIDYLQLLEPDNAKDPRQEQVAKMARRLKGLAREMEVPVLCLAQLNRQAEATKDNRPRLSHLRESGAIEQDADVVMFVHREEYYHSGEEATNLAGKAQIIISKQRNGPIGDIDLHWRKEFTRFEDISHNERHEEFDSYNQAPGNAAPDQSW